MAEDAEQGEPASGGCEGGRRAAARGGGSRPALDAARTGSGLKRVTVVGGQGAERRRGAANVLEVGVRERAGQERGRRGEHAPRSHRQRPRRHVWKTTGPTREPSGAGRGEVRAGTASAFGGRASHLELGGVDLDLAVGTRRPPCATGQPSTRSPAHALAPLVPEVGTLAGRLVFSIMGRIGGARRTSPEAVAPASAAATGRAGRPVPWEGTFTPRLDYPSGGKRTDRHEGSVAVIEVVVLGLVQLARSKTTVAPNSVAVPRLPLCLGRHTDCSGTVSTPGLLYR